MTSGLRLLEKISGFPEEKIKRIIERRENTHIQVLKDLNLIQKPDSLKNIIERVLGVGLKFENWQKITREFVSVCLFVLEVDNPLLDELVVLRNRTVEEWNRVIKKLKETKPSTFWKGKPYEDEKIHSCRANGCIECRDKMEQQETLENQLKGYFPINPKSKPVEKSELEQLQIFVRKLQNECIRCWEINEEFGGLLKKPGWQTSYVFGTDKMARVLRRHLNDMDVIDSTRWDTSNLGISQGLMTAVKQIQKLGIEVCFIRLSDTLKVVVKSGIAESATTKIQEEVNELNDKPPSKADILRTLTRHSVGILLWKNHCQATVTCVGENVVLTSAHIFTPDKSEIWNHLLKMYCEKLFPLSALKSKTFCNLRQECYKYLTKSKGNSTSGLEVSFKEFIRKNWETTIQKDISNELRLEMRKNRDSADAEKRAENIIQELAKNKEVSAGIAALEEMNKEIKKLAEVREEDLVNLYAEEIKIHIGHMEDVEDHFKAKCCRYYVKEVILLDHKLDVAVLKIAESDDFKSKQEDIMSIRQEIVPMPITSATVPNGYLFIAAHPFGKTLCMESSVKLLEKSEKFVFVENFITQAILQAASKNRISILRHVENAGVFERLPVCVFWDKFKYQSVKNLIKRNDTDWKIAYLEYDEAMEYDFEKGFIIPTENITVKPKKDKKQVEVCTKRLLIPGKELQDNDWQDYSLEKFWHSNLPKRGDLQIPIPSANKKRSTRKENGETSNSGNGQPYRFILTSRYDQASYACQITEDVNDEKKSILKIKKLDHPIIVEESDKPVVLSLLSEVVCIKCEIKCGKKGELFLNDEKMSVCTGTVKLERFEESKRPSNAEKPFEIWMNKPFDLPELSLSLQKDSEGKLSLHYSFREGRAELEKTLYFSLKQEKFLNIELENKILKKRSEKHRSVIVNVAVDEETSHIENVNGKIQDQMMKNAEKKKKDAIRLKEEAPGKSWTGNILLKRKCTDKNEYCRLEVRVDTRYACDENNTPLKIFSYSHRAELQKSRKWIMKDETYVVWPTFSWSTDFVLQFCKKEKSRVTFSIHNTFDSYRIMEFDPNGKQLLRHIHSSGNPTVPGIIIYVENKRLGKLGSANKGMKSHYVQTLNRSFSRSEIKENIVTEKVKTSGMKKYIRMKQLAHTKLIDMEHGASGGACCFIGDQGQLLLHGMFLGACPSFYYNNAECKLFFNKTGTCFNEVLPSKCLIDRLKVSVDEQIKAKLVPNSQDPESFFINIFEN